MNYKIIETEDEKEFHLVGITFGVYEALKMAQLKCSAFDVADKLKICKEFNLEPEEAKAKPEFGTRELYAKYVDLLFLEPVENLKIEDIDISEVNRAARDFFSMAIGQ